jgi:hypothetical protein
MANTLGMKAQDGITQFNNINEAIFCPLSSPAHVSDRTSCIDCFGKNGPITTPYTQSAGDIYIYFASQTQWTLANVDTNHRIWNAERVLH